MIVYPMGLPPHDPIKQELENTEDLSGTQVKSKTDILVSYRFICKLKLMHTLYVFTCI